MEITQILGYFGALVIGIILGLIGGGGSILTVPVLVYLFYINPVTATAYSLFVVGISALVGAINNIKKRLIDFRTAIVFSIPAFIAVYISRKYLVPAIPEELITIGTFVLTKNVAIMVFFAIIMLIASISMIRDVKETSEGALQRIAYNYPLIIVEGLVVGILTGIVGAGGGFLIIPALVLFAKLPMKKAVATSLLIIAIKSLIGFIGDIETLNIDWYFLLTFTFISTIGIFIGVWLNRFINGKKLKKSFGWFVLIMGIYIIIMEISR
ncbi:sulfite exporter TauE/SafE family protein [Aureisphaera sp. CAU 1614]|uniref:Probable membrane transporter protein n=1 Tax=Halomarinibacterium sedimenti TaxID=2857106 RepID=A0A9X1JUT5_9FLAO|nr:sulfite exporter TauE/SafE family protein [Halomarinibacterium sedimenti]MBW2937204.1 sulfite exporter TauE/SafE family protein [Halomarinibacterium sedimenti]